MRRHHRRVVVRQPERGRAQQRVGRDAARRRQARDGGGRRLQGDLHVDVIVLTTRATVHRGNRRRAVEPERSWKIAYTIEYSDKNLSSHLINHCR